MLTSLALIFLVGRPAILMSFLPAVFEIAAFVLFAPLMLGVNRIEAAIMGAVLGAVSPTIVVPRMVELIERRYGTNKGIPQMILAGASLDDVFVIVLFSTFVSMAQGGNTQVMDFVNIPISIVLGLLLGAATGAFLSWFFETNYSHQHLVRNSMKVIVVLGMAFMLLAIEDWLSGIISVSGLLAIFTKSDRTGCNWFHSPIPWTPMRKSCPFCCSPIYFDYRTAWSNRNGFKL